MMKATATATSTPTPVQQNSEPVKRVRTSFGTVARKTGRSIVTWEWTKKLLYWLIISAGTMSECVFLIASIWFSINANVHKFVLLFINEGTTQHITELATTAYVALPECIVGLAVITTLSHVRMIMYKRKDFRAWIWSALYGLPTLVFLGLSLYTLGQAVANDTFEMPKEWVVIRALAGFMFAFTSFLYTQLGVPQEADRLAQKDTEIAAIRKTTGAKIAELEKEITRVNVELAQEKTRLIQIIDQQKEEMTKVKRQKEELVNEALKASESALQAYSQECIDWLKSGVKSVSVDEVTRFTGHSKRKVNNAMSAGKFQSPGRNKDLILVSSLIEWLEQNPPKDTDKYDDIGPNLHIVNG